MCAKLSGTELLGKHFLLYPVEELQRMYEDQNVITRIVHVDPREPYLSIVFIYKDEMEDA